jgi:hypothetical protein
MNKLLTALILVATAATAQAQTAREAGESIKGQDYVAMLNQCKSVSNAPVKSLTEQERKVVETAVKEQLKDPESAKFSNISVVSLQDVCMATTPYKDTRYDANKMSWEVVTVTKEKSRPIIKGYVNAKNSYGGYTGDRSFVLYENLAIKF